MSRAFVVAGVSYCPVEVCTAERDAWLVGRMNRAGLFEVTLRPDESLGEWAVRFMLELMATGEAFAVLGGLVVREGAAWSPEAAEETANHLRATTAEEDKEAMFGFLLAGVLAFFESGLASFWTTRTSSQKGRPGPN